MFSIEILAPVMRSFVLVENIPDSCICLRFFWWLYRSLYLLTFFLMIVQIVIFIYVFHDDCTDHYICLRCSDRQPLQNGERTIIRNFRSYFNYILLQMHISRQYSKQYSKRKKLWRSPVISNVNLRMQNLNRD